MLLIRVLMLCLLTIQVFGADEPAKPAPTVTAQAEDGSLTLHAKDVTIHGKTVRYEPQPHKNTIGYWTKAEDWVSWDFTLSKGGTFTVTVLEGCGKGSGGSTYTLSVGEQKIDDTVVDTGGFQNFVSRDIGTMKLEPGTHTLSVKPTKKAGAAVMDLRMVTLKPVEKKP